MQCSSPKKCSSSIICPPCHLITTLPSLDGNSPPPPFYNLHKTPSNKTSPHDSQLSPFSSPPYIQFFSPEDTTFDNSSNNFSIHNVWQSTKLYPSTPPLLKINDITLTTVNSIFNQPDSPVKIYSSCRFPPEKIELLLFLNISSLLSFALLIVQLLFHQR